MSPSEQAEMDRDFDEFFEVLFDKMSKKEIMPEQARRFFPEQDDKSSHEKL